MENSRLKNSDHLLKHLDYLQNIIARMNSNSFYVKFITITIITVVSIIFTFSDNKTVALVISLSTIPLWLLDSYYLQQERKVRAIYSNVAEIENEYLIKDFDVPTHKITGMKFSFGKSCFSITMILFYGAIFKILLILFFLSK